MPFKLLLFLIAFVTNPLATAQTRAANSDAPILRARIETSPTLPFHAVRFTPHPPARDRQLGAISSVAIAPNGVIYLIQRGKQVPPVVALDPEGNVLRSWGAGNFAIPHTVRVDPSDNIWTVDAGSSTVIKYSPTGKTLLEIVVGEQPRNGSAFNGTTDIAFAHNGHIFITDGYGNARVLEFSATGQRLRQWGHRGSGPGDFNLPHSIQIDEQGTIYIADRENGRIEEFDLNGNYLREIAHLGRTYSIKVSGNAIWATMEPFNQEPGSGSCWLVKLDKQTGTILGHLDITEVRAGHSVDITSNGEPIITEGSELLWFKADKP